MATITITHQLEKTKHRFTVKDPNFLTQSEVNRICQGMYVQAIFVNGRFYDCDEPLDIDKHLAKLMKPKRSKKG